MGMIWIVLRCIYQSNEYKLVSIVSIVSIYNQIIKPFILHRKVIFTRKIIIKIIELNRFHKHIIIQHI